MNKPRSILALHSLISSVGAFFVLFCFPNMLNYKISWDFEAHCLCKLILKKAFQ